MHLASQRFTERIRLVDIISFVQVGSRLISQLR